MLLVTAHVKVCYLAYDICFVNLFRSILPVVPTECDVLIVCRQHNYYSGRPDVGVGDVVDGVGADVDVEVSLAAQQGGCFAGGPACVRAEVHHRVKPTCTMHQHTTHAAASTDRQ